MALPLRNFLEDPSPLSCAPRSRSLGWALFALLLLLAPGCSRSASESPNLLVVVVDTLRQDRLGCYGYDVRPTSPELDQLAGDAIRFDALIGCSPWTLPSLATLMTGLHPAGHGVARLSDGLADDRTLAEVLRRAGYRTGAVTANYMLRRGSGFDAGFEQFDDAPGRYKNEGSPAAETVQRGLNWLAELEDDEPWFLYLHFFDPHNDYVENAEAGFLSEGYVGPVRSGANIWELRDAVPNFNAADRARLDALYDGEVRAVDTALGRILRALRARGEEEETIVVFTSDHGEELAERGWIGHTRTLHHELVGLPLIVRLPGGEGAGTVVETLLPQRDLYATILDWCGLPVGSARGRSFASSVAGDLPSRPCYSEVDFVPEATGRAEKDVHQVGVTDGRWRLLRDLRADQYLLFDRIADPLELQNRFGEAALAGEVERLQALLNSHRFLERR